MRTTGLVRVTVAAPRRRIDVALPEQSLLAEVLPGLLQHAGEGLADDGVDGGGWMLRRTDGTPLELGRTLTSYRIRDGEVLHLVTRSTEWPELEYDDLVDAIATGAGRTGRLWSPRHTRTAGLVLGALAVSLTLVTVLWSDAPVDQARRWILGIGAVLLIAGTLMSRAAGDSGTGAVLGGLSLPFAAVGGALLLPGDGRPDLGTPQLLTASAMLLIAGALGLFGIVDRAGVFVCAIALGSVGLTGGWLAGADSLEPFESAAIVGAGLLMFSPLYGPLAIRLGRVPMPVLPRNTADLVRDEPQPPRPKVYQAVRRADGILTGMLLAIPPAVALSTALLVRSGRTSAIWLVALLTVGFALRARLYPAVRHRLPVLAAALAGALSLAFGPLMAGPQRPLGTPTLVLLAAAAAVVLTGLLTSTRPLSPYLGRYAELLETVIVLATVPVCCAVLGLYGVLRGLGG